MDKVMLTDAKLKGLKAPASGRIEISDANVAGLRVRLGPSGRPSFIFRKRVGGKPCNIALGTFSPRFTLADARKKARTLVSDIEAGLNPAADARAQAKRKGPGSLTIRNMLPDYIAAKRLAGRRSVDEMERTLTRDVLPVLGDRLADTVTRGDVTRLIEDIQAPVQARAVHAQLSAFYTWAMPALDRLPANPCRDARRPEKPKSRERVLTDRELQALWRVAEGEAQPWRSGLQLLILTGQRREEVFAADRAEIDAKGKLWTIPRERAKNGAEHLVPLSDGALAALAVVPEVKDASKLFTTRMNSETGPSGFSKAMTRIRKALDKELETAAPHWTLHDIRRTVATGMQRLGITAEVVEAVLNHISGSKAGIAGVYQRHKFLAEKRHALDAWGAEVARIVKGKGRDNVVPLRRKRAAK